MNHGCRIGAGLLSNDRNVVALAPDLQLFDGRSPECIPGSQHDRESLFAESPCELADRRRLARAVDADHQDYERGVLPGNLQRYGDRFEDVEHRALQSTAKCVKVLQLATRQAFLQVTDDPPCRFHADIGHDQQRFEFLEDGGIDSAARSKLCEVIGQPAVAPVQTGPQSLQEALSRFGLLCICKHGQSSSPAERESPKLCPETR